MSDPEQAAGAALEPAPPETGEAPAESWVGRGLEPFEVGNPGRAGREVGCTLPLTPSDPADTQLDGGDASRLTIRAASVRGISHRQDGKPRQDDYALARSSGHVVVAVTDGVSAGRLSHQAATLACRGAAAHVAEALDAGGEPGELPWYDVLDAAARRIMAHGRRVLADSAEEGEVTPEQVAGAMATTIVVAVLPATPDEQGRHAGVVFAFGDTSAFRLGIEGTWTPVTDVKNDGAEIASSRTSALPYLPQEPVSSRDVVLAPGEALFVMTDGVGDPLGNGSGVVGRFLADVWREPPDPLSFAGQVGFARKSFDDDRTVVGVWARA